MFYRHLPSLTGPKILLVRPPSGPHTPDVPDTLVRIAELEHYRLMWSERIQADGMRSILDCGSNLSADSVERRIAAIGEVCAHARARECEPVDVNPRYRIVMIPVPLRSKN